MMWPRDKITVVEWSDQTGGHATRRTWPQTVHGQFIFFPNLFSNVARRQNYCYGRVRPNRMDRPKKIKLKQGIFTLRTMENLMPTLWRDKQDIYMVTNIHNPSTEVTVC
jgi:hypothetical protein